MAKGRPPPFVTRGKAAAVPARMSRAPVAPPAGPPMPPPDMGGGAPPMFRRGGKVPFEGSKFDVERKGAPEGSAADRALDKKQMAAAGYNKGGKVGGSFPMGKSAKMPR